MPLTRCSTHITWFI